VRASKRRHAACGAQNRQASEPPIPVWKWAEMRSAETPAGSARRNTVEYAGTRLNNHVSERRAARDTPATRMPNAAFSTRPSGV